MLGMALATGAAWACGGTMCDGTTTTQTVQTTTTTTTTTTGTFGTASADGGGPIVQTGERIVFLEEPDGWTTFVQIQTQGDDEKFGWVIPIPRSIDPAEVTVAPEGMMDDLERVTAPRFITDQGTLSGAAEPTSAGCNCGEGLFEDLLLDAVEQLGTAVVGPYEITMLDGNDPEGLAAWILQGGYRVPFTTWPLVDDYVSRDYSFLAVRMLPFAGMGQGTVQTLRFPCAQETPTIPLTLTSIAAVADMPVTTYILSDRRYEPANDWPEIDFDPSSISPDGAGGTDYGPRVRAVLDGMGGRGFRTEFAGPVEQILGDLDRETAEALGSGAYLTRLQSWASPEEMLSDPEFLPSPDGASDVSNEIDLRTSRASGLGGLGPLMIGLFGLSRRRRESAVRR